MVFQKTISIDFDNTITSGDTGKINDIPPPRLNAQRIIRKWYDEGYIIIINTLRGRDEWESAARDYLARYEIPFHYFNENTRERINHYGDVRKVGADIYIDDRNLMGLPEDFNDIYLLVRRKIGPPNKIRRGRMIESYNYDANIPLRSSSIDMASTHFDSNWSNEFIEKLRVSAISNLIYRYLIGGEINPYQAIEMLVTQIEHKDSIILSQLNK